MPQIGDAERDGWPGEYTAAGVEATRAFLRRWRIERTKVARATTAAICPELGKTWCPKKPWRDEWDAEIVTFPHSRHDDQVDVLAYAAMQINKKRRHPNMIGWRLDPDLRKERLFR